MDRRDFLVVSGLGLLGVALGNRLSYAGANRSPEDLSHALAHNSNARAIGRCYLTQHPEEADWDYLAGAVYGDDYPAPDIMAGHPPLASRVAQRVAADFEAGRVVNLNGWMLASTEARLCAMAALI